MDKKPVVGHGHKQLRRWEGRPNLFDDLRGEPVTMLEPFFNVPVGEFDDQA
jgi:hypothetical protein